MLRQVFIVKDTNVLYERDFGKAISKNDFRTLFLEIRKTAFMGTESKLDSFDYFKYKVSYITDNELMLAFVFVTSLTDTSDRIRMELTKLKKEFLNLFKDVISTSNSLDSSLLEVLNPTIDGVHKNLRPKISLIGFSGVGKTTITRLIRAEEIPMEHVATITGEITTIKIGKLHFHLWDFAGQEQFSYLWNNFIKGSDAVLLITDSTIENVEKSNFFIELIKDQAPHAQAAIIANKQDLPKAIKPEKVESVLGLKTYSMIAKDTNNRDKMIQIIADILEMNSEISPLLKPLFERDQMMFEAQKALENGEFAKAVAFFEKIGDLCLDLGDDSLSKEFFEKSEKLKTLLKNTS